MIKFIMRFIRRARASAKVTTGLRPERPILTSKEIDAIVNNIERMLVKKGK